MKSISRTLIMLILASIMAFGLTGCAKETIVATINNEKVSEPLYRIFLWSTQRGLESIMPNIWEMDTIEGKTTPEELAKERALSSIAYNIAVKQKAEELGIKLTKEEKNTIKEAAKTSLDSNADLSTTYNIKQKDYETYLTYGILNEKVTQVLGETYIPNQEELEEMSNLLREQELVASATITQVLISNRNELGELLPEDKNKAAYREAAEILDLALAGEEMSELAKHYSDDAAVNTNNGKYTFERGTMDEQLEKVVFELATVGEVYPEVIETAMGYEVVRVEDVTVPSEQEIQELATAQIQSQFVSDELTEASRLFNIEKADSYDEIHIMVID